MSNRLKTLLQASIHSITTYCAGTVNRTYETDTLFIINLLCVLVFEIDFLWIASIGFDWQPSLLCLQSSDITGIGYHSWFRDVCIHQTKIYSCLTWVLWEKKIKIKITGSHTGSARQLGKGSLWKRRALEPIKKRHLILDLRKVREGDQQKENPGRLSSV